MSNRLTLDSSARTRCSSSPATAAGPAPGAALLAAELIRRAARYAELGSGTSIPHPLRHFRADTTEQAAIIEHVFRR